MSYQEITGSLMASGYDKLGTQEALNGMYVTERERVTAWDGSQVCSTLTCNNANGGQRMPDKENFNAVVENNEPQYAVRRLTPRECERLQGFPDDWTMIGEKEVDALGNVNHYWTDTSGKRKKLADSPRYKALGNSIALPFWRFLAKNITAQYDRPITIGSLFDGIGGFPKVFEECNGPGTARWASEIEEFPIAVTKQHFPEPEWLD